MGGHENRSVSNMSFADSELEVAMTHDSKILIDAHCHLDRLKKKLKLTTGGLWELQSKFKFPSCFEGCITAFCDPRTWFKRNGGLNDFVVKLREENQHYRVKGDVRFTFGCHPKLANHMNEGRLASLELLLRMEDVAAVGEIGLGAVYI